MLLPSPATGDYTVTVRSFNVPNGPQPFALVVTGGFTAGGPTTVTFTSVASQDGYVLESSETSNAGGSGSSTSTGTSALRAGDATQDRQYKGFVSFNTSSIPDGATIVSATLRLRRGTVAGTNPFGTHGTCWADVQTGGFSGSTTLQTGDFQAAATAVQAASLTNAPNNLDWSEGGLNAAGLAAINKSGTTQLRVYFALGDNDDGGTDYIGWYSGDNATAANRPQLVVTYQ
ncbi:MAG: DNRLRE domain-containing protein [Candidatus Rokuibacteriota bacterium]